MKLYSIFNFQSNHRLEHDGDGGIPKGLPSHKMQDDSPSLLLGELMTLRIAWPYL